MVEADPLGAPLKRAVGDRTAKVLERTFGMRTVGDLLRHYPRRYQERGELTDLADLMLEEEATVLAEVARVNRRQFRERRGSILEVVVTDGTSKLTLTFFNQNWRERELRPGRVGLFSGRITDFRGTRQLANPDYEMLSDEDDAEEKAERFSAALIPIYPAVHGMSSPKIQKCVKVVLDGLHEVPDPLPQRVREEHRLIGLKQALEQIHRPIALSQAYQAKDRLKWDEALPLQVALAQRRRTALETPARPRRAKPGGEHVPRYFADASYCQAGIRWPAYGASHWREILTKARDCEQARGGTHAHLFEESHFFDDLAARAFLQSKQGSLVLEMQGWKE